MNARQRRMLRRAFEGRQIVAGCFKVGRGPSKRSQRSCVKRAQVELTAAILRGSVDMGKLEKHAQSMLRMIDKK